MTIDDEEIDEEVAAPVSVEIEKYKTIRFVVGCILAYAIMALMYAK